AVGLPELPHIKPPSDKRDDNKDAVLNKKVRKTDNNFGINRYRLARVEQYCANLRYHEGEHERHHAEEDQNNKDWVDERVLGFTDEVIGAVEVIGEIIKGG